MQIGIIGTGLMGSALGYAWASAGHQIVFSYSRDRKKLEAAAAYAGHGARPGAPSDAAASDVVLLSVHWQRVADALQHAGSLRGKTLISCMLPMSDDDEHLALGFSTSAAETLAERTGAHVVETFNTVWSDVIRQNRQDDTTRPSMFYVGDHIAAKATTAGLIRDAGFDPVDVGGLENARLLEPFGLLMGKMGFAYHPLVAYRFLNQR